MVAPRRGAWIETPKHGAGIVPKHVAPRRGAWIETQEEYEANKDFDVAPRRGAWIETRLQGKKGKGEAGRAPQGRVD